ncbi:hypothetical protein BaRGS_00003931, partial [Batillaria attramentaria]
RGETRCLGVSRVSTAGSASVRRIVKIWCMKPTRFCSVSSMHELCSVCSETRHLGCHISMKSIEISIHLIDLFSPAVDSSDASSSICMEGGKRKSPV